MPQKYTSLEDFWTRIDEPRKALAPELRHILLSIEPELEEKWKWNAPSFASNSLECLTFNLSSARHVRIVFHAGTANKEDKTGSPLFGVGTGLLQWQSNIRIPASFKSLDDVETRRADLHDVTRRWLNVISSPHPGEV
jgi:hypothetical protein